MMLKNRNLILFAPNTHVGGGKVLLGEILRTINAAELAECRLIVDARMDLPKEIEQYIQISKVTPSVLGRLKAELLVRSLCRNDDMVLCFGSIPPLFKSQGSVIVFMQNRYMIESVPVWGLGLKAGIRIWAERFWLRLCFRKVKKFIVQTPSMKVALKKAICREAIILPFIPDYSNYNESLSVNSDNENKYDFIYVASGEQHKNHRNLVEAWKLLSEEGVTPSLCFTLAPEYASELCTWIEDMTCRYDLCIRNIGNVPICEIKTLYNKARALIYPSVLESFGLPLTEARIAGLPILASELDYVRDVVDPVESFDPSSPVSIARAVKRFLKVPSEPLYLVDAKTFLEKLIIE